MVETRVAPAPARGRELAAQYAKYSFFKVDRAWRRLEVRERAAHKAEFLEAIDGFREEMLLYSYAMLGLRGDADFMLFQGWEELDRIPVFHGTLLRTGLGGYLDTPYSYLAVARRSPYLGGHRHEDQEGTRRHLRPAGSRYIFVYPFVKTHQWYQLSLERRQELMQEHFQIGHRYPGVKINTTYSFGLDDQEHVVAFEADDPLEWMACVMELREAAVRPYTLRDTPNFSGARMELAEILDLLG